MSFSYVSVAGAYFSSIGKEPVQLHTLHTWTTENMNIALTSELCGSLSSITIQTKEVDQVCVTYMWQVFLDINTL